MFPVRDLTSGALVVQIQRKGQVDVQSAWVHFRVDTVFPVTLGVALRQEKAALRKSQGEAFSRWCFKTKIRFSSAMAEQLKPASFAAGQRSGPSRMLRMHLQDDALRRARSNGRGISSLKKRFAEYP